MTIETEVASLTQATTDLLSAVNVKKAALDAAEANAVNALDSFESQYIGARSSAPATDADGDPVQTGALYYNTTNTTMYVYSGSAWAALVDNLVIDPNATMLSNIATNGNDIKFGDNDKATFGASDDLQIYHDGTKNRVVGSVDVTGTLTADGLTVDGELDVNAVGVVNIGTRADMFFDIDSNNDQINRQLGITSDNGVRRLFTAVEGGNVLFYEDTGTTAKMVWDASQESLSIGTAVPLGIGQGLRVAGGVFIDGDLTSYNANGFMIGYDGSNAKIAVGGTSGASRGMTFSTVSGGVEGERMRIDSAGNVGIGASTPACHLEVKGSGNGGVSEHLRITSTDTESKLAFVTTTGTGAIAQTDGELRFMTSGANTERMRINSAGNVGIGTASPDHTLRVNGDGRVGNLHIKTSEYTAGTGKAIWADTAGTGVLGLNSSTALQFNTNNTERARIDSSGNLLVAKSAISTATVGHMALSSGLLASTRSGGEVAVLNRLASDGDIINFRKDGTTVGSIGTDIGRIHIGSDDCRLFFDGGGTKAIWPWSDTATLPGDASNTINLGDSLNKFKDLYLSGGVYLGGTGAANKLDDYEEGTWTPTIIGSTGGTANANAVTTSYTKIGNTVRVDCYLNLSDVTGLSGAVRLSGLPFTGSGYSPITVSHCSLFDFDERTDTVGGFIESGSAFVNLTFGSASSTIPSTNATATSGTIMFHATYKTTQ